MSALSAYLTKVEINKFTEFIRSKIILYRATFYIASTKGVDHKLYDVIFLGPGPGGGGKICFGWRGRYTALRVAVARYIYIVYTGHPVYYLYTYIPI